MVLSVLEFFRRPQKISHWFLEVGPSVTVRNDLSPGLRPRKPQENFARSPSFLLLSASRPKALPNTDQFSSNCVSRLARSLGPSVIVIPLQALGSEPFVYTRARARAHTYVHAHDVARNPGIPCWGTVATGSARSDASNTPLRWKQWSATGFSLGGNSRIRIANRARKVRRVEMREKERAIDSSTWRRTRFRAISMERINAKTLHPLAAIVRVRRSR